MEVRRRGFTLIELSIVLVIVGLIVGGVFVGQDLVQAARIRSQISQITKVNSSVRTFQTKYNALPGDMLAGNAIQNGFITTSCNGTQGSRNGDGVLDSADAPYHQLQGFGEVALFWADLTSSNLIDGAFPPAGVPALACGAANAVPMSLTPGSNYLGNYFPSAKIGRTNFIYVYENNNVNWFGVSALTSVDSARVNSGTSIAVIEAYSIDTKLDDGLPLSGNVQAVYLNNTGGVMNAPGVFSLGDDPTTCMSVGANNVRYYSLSAAANYGTGLNCALSFRFQ